MRLLLPALAVAAALLYFTFGLRLGYVTLMPTQLLNAQGQNSYAYQLYEDSKSVGVRGTCTVRGGRATLRLLDPSGTQIAGQACPPGRWSVTLTASGHPGIYRLLVDFNHYNGELDLDEVRD